ncbi:hypothetical protein SPRG_09294 [Saprolegnia parasitica CBS 223.65]|uniref:LRRNT domain-containing protein n=1 Tax=Saprolegnia parasitica (strain CBS 223.65) TaxID=695850 RepID=A0A067CF34_SAPPC|nr:hypothetical protein SPRG_09294 [Saprolegnia parasitica CBS 223.65]KDO25146.1 hypothetical protein SPRG_09294 [Saprolegnia parasitica CBS 223.65]|eukprot:XP_012204214.1 hypothetical protein SPRG_09294 [Saprolegnia parasitica CBS 223.65]
MADRLLRLMLLLLLMAPVAMAAVACLYSSYPPDLLVYTADAACPIVGRSCIINSTDCTVVNNITLDQETKTLPFFNAVGDLSSSTIVNMKIGNKTSLVMKDMRFPASLKALQIQNISRIDFTQLKTQFPSTLVSLGVLDSNLEIFPATFQWPDHLRTMYADRLILDQD